MRDIFIHDFVAERPPFETDQEASLEWLAALHARAERSDDPEAFARRMTKLFERCGCLHAIRSRGHVIDDVHRRSSEMQIYDVEKYPHGRGTAERNAIFAEFVNRYFIDSYRDVMHAPSDVIHVTCTGYASPSGAQRMVASRGWGDRTRVTHAYHMGCYAAFPALRIAAGLLPEDRDERVDIVHTEACTLHLDPLAHDPEQLVVQSLFGDGMIRYSLSGAHSGSHGLALLSLDERILPDSASSMSWVVSNFGMHMTLARDVPERIAGTIRNFVNDLCDARTRRSAVFAIHPGGPKIIDAVAHCLELETWQAQTSRDVLSDCGNMSSATLPHIWMRIANDDRVARGTPIVSLAFGPGLTVCGGVFVKR